MTYILSCGALNSTHSLTGPTGVSCGHFVEEKWTPLLPEPRLWVRVANEIPGAVETARTGTTRNAINDG